VCAHRAKPAPAAHPCLVGCTVLGHTPLFARPEPSQRVIDVWRKLQDDRRLQVFGFVLMDDHAQLIASAADMGAVVELFRSQSAAEILQLLESPDMKGLLKSLRRHQAEAAAGPAALLWEQAVDIEPIRDPATMRAKLDLIHQSPVKHGYVQEPTLYRYSSARNYAGQPGLLRVTTEW
jgi:putative transposase